MPAHKLHWHSFLYFSRAGGAGSTGMAFSTFLGHALRHRLHWHSFLYFSWAGPGAAVSDTAGSGSKLCVWGRGVKKQGFEHKAYFFTGGGGGRVRQSNVVVACFV